MSTLAELKAAGERAAAIEHKLSLLKDAEHKLALVNKFAAENKGKSWSVGLALEKRDNYSGHQPARIDVDIPYEYIVRQAINEVIDARRKVVLAGGDVPTASEQVQRGRQ